MSAAAYYPFEPSVCLKLGPHAAVILAKLRFQAYDNAAVPTSISETEMVREFGFSKKVLAPALARLIAEGHLETVTERRQGQRQIFRLARVLNFPQKEEAGAGSFPQKTEVVSAELPPKDGRCFGNFPRKTEAPQPTSPLRGDAYKEEKTSLVSFKLASCAEPEAQTQTQNQNLSSDGGMSADQGQFKPHAILEEKALTELAEGMRPICEAFFKDPTLDERGAKTILMLGRQLLPNAPVAEILHGIADHLQHKQGRNRERRWDTPGILIHTFLPSLIAAQKRARSDSPAAAPPNPPPEPQEAGQGALTFAEDRVLEQGPLPIPPQSATELHSTSKKQCVYCGDPAAHIHWTRWNHCDRQACLTQFATDLANRPAAKPKPQPNHQLIAKLLTANRG